MEIHLSQAPDGYPTCDNSPAICRADHKAVLPRDARLPINRCNLPAVILGSPTYQAHPTPLVLDGVGELHRQLFDKLDRENDMARRAEIFQDYLVVQFRLESPEDAGLTAASRSRAKASYQRTLRGWSFDADSREGAVLKAWVESRFGLTPRHHGESLRDQSTPAYLRYLEMRSQGLYGTNALEAQLDLIYTYCQYELSRRHPGATHLTLYRGINRLGEHEVLDPSDKTQPIVLFNNLNSFTCNRERACEFGDYILTTQVPLSKLFFYCGLLPGILRGEDEFLVIGGAYRVEMGVM